MQKPDDRETPIQGGAATGSPRLPDSDAERPGRLGDRNETDNPSATPGGLMGAGGTEAANARALEEADKVVLEGAAKDEAQGGARAYGDPGPARPADAGTGSTADAATGLGHGVSATDGGATREGATSRAVRDANRAVEKPTPNTQKQLLIYAAAAIALVVLLILIL